jgi:hypothetical protein
MTSFNTSPSVTIEWVVEGKVRFRAVITKWTGTPAGW